MGASKKILFSYENFLPTGEADAEVVFNTAGALAARGHICTLLTPEPPHVSSDFEREVLDYYDVGAPLKVTPVKSFTKSLALQHLYHAWRLPRHPAFREADFVYARNPVVAMSALRGGQRVFMDHYRPWADQFPPLQPVFRRFMTDPRFLGLVVHSDFARRAYQRLGIPEGKIKVVHNGCSPNRMLPRLSKVEARARLGLPNDRRIVTYTGRVNEKKGLEIILELAGRIPDVLFVIAGSTGRGPIEKAAESKDNVLVVPWQPPDAVAPYLYASDVLTIPPSSRPLLDIGNTVLPLKLFLYLAAGRAIFAGISPDTAEILEHDRNAWLVTAGNASEAERALRELLSDEGRLTRLGEAARRQSDDLTWQSRAAKIDDFIEERLAAGNEQKATWSGTQCLGESLRWLRLGVTTGRWVYKPRSPSVLTANARGGARADPQARSSIG